MLFTRKHSQSEQERLDVMPVFCVDLNNGTISELGGGGGEHCERAASER